MKTEITNEKAENQAAVIGCFSEENRIKHLFKDGELKKINYTESNKRILKNMGTKFRLNQTEVNWLDSERKKPNKDTQKLIDIVSEIKCTSKVIRLKNNL